jgi:hypothetical protein
MSYRYNEHDNDRAIMAPQIDRAISNGQIRPHERERAIELAVSNWHSTGGGNGRAAEAAVTAIQKGL